MNVAQLWFPACSAVVQVLGPQLLWNGVLPDVHGNKKSGITVDFFRLLSCRSESITFHESWLSLENLSWKVKIPMPFYWPMVGRFQQNFPNFPAHASCLFQFPSSGVWTPPPEETCAPALRPVELPPCSFWLGDGLCLAGLEQLEVVQPISASRDAQVRPDVRHVPVSLVLQGLLTRLRNHTNRQRSDHRLFALTQLVWILWALPFLTEISRTGCFCNRIPQGLSCHTISDAETETHWLKMLFAVNFVTNIIASDTQKSARASCFLKRELFALCVWAFEGQNSCIRSWRERRGPIHTGCAGTNKQMEPADVNGSVHTGCKQHQKELPANLLARVQCGLGQTAWCWLSLAFTLLRWPICHVHISITINAQKPSNRTVGVSYWVPLSAENPHCWKALHAGVSCSHPQGTRFSWVWVWPQMASPGKIGRLTENGCVSVTLHRVSVLI